MLRVFYEILNISKIYWGEKYMLKKIFMLAFLSIFISAAAFCFSEDDISAAEYARYGRNFADESLGERLNRLETDFFGMSQTGSINSRLENLSRMASNIKNDVNSVLNNNYYEKKPKKFFRKILDNLTSGFGADEFITGYTPSVINTISSSGGLNYYNSRYPYSGWNNNYYNNYNNYNSRYNYPYHTNYFDRTGSLYRNNNPYMYHNPYGNYPYNHTAPYTSRTGYYIPPQVETQSSIHILKD